MRASRILAMSWENLTQRKLRTSLTTLGVVIGIAAIVGLASLGEGFRVEIRDRIEQGFELDVLIVIPGSFTAALRQPFTPQEVNSVRNVTGVKLVAPLITLPQAKVYNGTNQKINAFTLAAVNFSEMAQMMGERFIPIEGDIPSETENDTIVLGYKACFLSETTRLAEVGDNVTMQIELQTQLGTINVSKTLTVAAILGKSGTSGITNFDNWAFIPTKTAVDLMSGTEAYNIILVKVSDIEQSERIANDIENVFDNPYSISVLVPIAFVHQVDRILAVVQLFLMAVASISLLVA
jgi:putative ABC transport system permease protein